MEMELQQVIAPPHHRDGVAGRQIDLHRVAVVDHREAGGLVVELDRLQLNLDAAANVDRALPLAGRALGEFRLELPPDFGATRALVGPVCGVPCGGAMATTTVGVFGRHRCAALFRGRMPCPMGRMCGRRLGAGHLGVSMGRRVGHPHHVRMLDLWRLGGTEALGQLLTQRIHRLWAGPRLGGWGGMPGGRRFGRRMRCVRGPGRSDSHRNSGENERSTQKGRSFHGGKIEQSRNSLSYRRLISKLEGWGRLTQNRSHCVGSN